MCLRQNRITCIEALECFPRLIELDLHDNGIVKIENLDGCTNLTYVRLPRSSNLHWLDADDAVWTLPLEFLTFPSIGFSALRIWTPLASTWKRFTWRATRLAKSRIWRVFCTFAPLNLAPTRSQYATEPGVLLYSVNFYLDC